MYFDQGDELAEQIFSPNPFEHGEELVEHIFQPNPKESNMFSRRRRIRRLRRRNPYRYNPDRGNCPHCDAGLRAKHYAQNQCWRCKRQLTRGRSRSLFGRAPRAALGIAARRRLRRYNPTDTSFFEHDAGVFGGPSWGRKRLRRYNPLWDAVSQPCARCGVVGCKCGCEGDPTLCTCSVSRRKNPAEPCARCGIVGCGCGCEGDPMLCTCLGGRINPCEDCGCDMCTCGVGGRYRYNPCEDCNGDPCTCGSHSQYHPNPRTTQHWDPVEAGTARWKPGQLWSEAEPEEDDDDMDRSYRYYRRNG